jgi:hypothetical protein
VVAVAPVWQVIVTVDVPGSAVGGTWTVVESSPPTGWIVTVPKAGEETVAGPVCPPHLARTETVDPRRTVLGLTDTQTPAESAAASEQPAMPNMTALPAAARARSTRADRMVLPSWCGMASRTYVVSYVSCAPTGPDPVNIDVIR